MGCQVLSGHRILSWFKLFLECVGGIAIVIGLIAVFYPSLFLLMGWIYLTIILVVSFFYATYKSWPKTNYTVYHSRPDTSISLLVGDIFKQEGHLVIGMTDTFDTEVPKIIKRTSIQGQLLENEFNNDVIRLNKELDQALIYANSEKIIDKNKTIGKNVRFPIGTVAVLGEVNKLYFCVAYSHMGNNSCAQSSPCDLWNSLDKLWEAIRQHGQKQQVSIPVVGSDLARLTNKLSRSELVIFIILSYLSASRQCPITKKLQIIIHPKDIKGLDIGFLTDFMRSI
ncbi:macro domain-containing protein [Legionella bozemanae]|uniref:macro domain-containing protein n=1 Tax=Legionella bozemanae TaxID=447 RepID=UPI00399C7E74